MITATTLGQSPDKTPIPMDINNDNPFEDACRRHVHNIKVQRMGRESSFKNIEKGFGKEASDYVRSICHTLVPQIKMKVAQYSETHVELSVNESESVDDIINRLLEEQILEMNSKNKYPVDQRWRDGMRNNYLMIMEYIDNSDYGALREFLQMSNKYWRKFYTAYTGVALPNSDKETIMFLFVNVGKRGR